MSTGSVWSMVSGRNRAERNDTQRISKTPQSQAGGVGFKPRGDRADSKGTLLIIMRICQKQLKKLKYPFNSFLENKTDNNYLNKDGNK
jgi:hypothetical protein